MRLSPRTEQPRSAAWPRNAALESSGSYVENRRRGWSSCNAAALRQAEWKQSVCGAAALKAKFAVGQAVQAAGALRAKTDTPLQGRQRHAAEGRAKGYCASGGRIAEGQAQECCLTPRSSADAQRHGTWPAKRPLSIMLFAGQAPRRRARLSSNVRPHGGVQRTTSAREDGWTRRGSVGEWQ